MAIMLYKLHGPFYGWSAVTAMLSAFILNNKSWKVGIVSSNPQRMKCSLPQSCQLGINGDTRN